MKLYSFFLFAAVLLGCQKEKETKDAPEEAALTFTIETYAKKTSLPCSEPCPHVDISVPVAQNIPVVADSINNKIFNTVRGIIFFGEKPYSAKTYDDLTTSFIGSYEELKREFPRDNLVGWEGKVDGSVAYKTDSIINIKISHYTYTGGAHGYAGERSLLFNAKTGKSLTNANIFKDEADFRAYAEKKFREKFKISEGKSINATGMMFEDDTFSLPQNIFYTDKGLLLYYNAYEIASYAEQQKELLLTYNEISSYLKIR